MTPPCSSMADRGWAEINAKPLGKYRFGAAAQERDTIPVVPPIAEPTYRMTRPELRQPPCPVCGNNGRVHCACQDTPSPPEDM
jgi:hypothetical protein